MRGGSHLPRYEGTLLSDKQMDKGLGGRGILPLACPSWRLDPGPGQGATLEMPGWKHWGQWRRWKERAAPHLGQSPAVAPRQEPSPPPSCPPSGPLCQGPSLPSFRLFTNLTQPLCPTGGFAANSQDPGCVPSLGLRLLRISAVFSPTRLPSAWESPEVKTEQKLHSSKQDSIFQWKCF